MFRYDLNAGTTGPLVFATEQNITALEATPANRNIGSGGQVRRGPDGKMYVARWNNASLATISSPDAATPTFVQSGQALIAAKPVYYGLPLTIGGCADGLPDTDGDGIIDLVDLDDDNDGVLDSKECLAQTAAVNQAWKGSGVNWSSSLGGNAVTATFSGAVALLV